MNWIDVNQEMPSKEGKYLVKTSTTMGNSHKVECHCHIHEEKGKIKTKFNVTNQIVTHWLKED